MAPIQDEAVESAVSPLDNAAEAAILIENKGVFVICRTSEVLDAGEINASDATGIRSGDVPSGIDNRANQSIVVGSAINEQIKGRFKQLNCYCIAARSAIDRERTGWCLKSRLCEGLIRIIYGYYSVTGSTFVSKYELIGDLRQNVDRGRCRRPPS